MSLYIYIYVTMIAFENRIKAHSDREGEHRRIDVYSEHFEGARKIMRKWGE